MRCSQENDTACTLKWLMCMCAGPIDFRHAFLDMTGIDVREGPNTRAGRTCPAAMGFSFAAGTTDGTYVWCFHLFTCAVMYTIDQPLPQEGRNGQAPPTMCYTHTLPLGSGTGCTCMYLTLEEDTWLMDECTHARTSERVSE